MGTTHETDTLIVGGGVIGCAIAYELAKAGVDVILLEKETLGSQSTRAGAGMLGAQVEMTEPGPMYELGVKSRALFPKLREELLEISGIDMELHTPGIFRVAVDEQDRTALLERQRWQTASGQRAVWFEDEDLRSEMGDLVAPRFGALYLPDDHQVRNPQLLLAMAASAKRLGVRMFEHTPMIGFLQENGAVTGVKTVDGVIRAERVIVAAGAWSGLLARQLGLELPVFPVKGQSFLLDSYAPPTPFTIYTHGCYILPKKNGQVYVGATEEQQAGFDRRPNLRSLASLSSQAVGLLPSLGDLPFSTPLAGLRPGSLDGLPYLGHVPGIEGLYIASGHFRNGVLLSAITGHVMAELLTGKPTSVDLEPFAVGRAQVV
ncbi:glycine oxidase [Tumebacillus sp. BK434]|nr:glycine oxidase [Tumebacillus sp. BK434]